MIILSTVTPESGLHAQRYLLDHSDSEPKSDRPASPIKTVNSTRSMIPSPVKIGTNHVIYQLKPTGKLSLRPRLRARNSVQ